jgi:hypothetical protein
MERVNLGTCAIEQLPEFTRSMDELWYPISFEKAFVGVRFVKTYPCGCAHRDQLLSLLESI